MVIFAANGIDDRHESGCDQPNRPPAILPIVLPVIAGLDPLRIEKDAGSILEADPMLAQVHLGLAGIPLKLRD
jgi:hypothetical protein